MRKIYLYLAVVLSLSVYMNPLQAQRKREMPSYEISSPPANLNLDSFYKKHVSASGYPVLGSEKVNDYALKEAAFLIDAMLAKRPDLRQVMIEYQSRCVVMAYNEFTTDVPEHSHLTPKDYMDARARGLGGSVEDPVCSVGEENLLSFEGDPYFSESILIHEFAHNIHLRGLINLDSSFDDRLKATYDRAMQLGLWRTKYASVNHFEYWAEGVQSWFGNNRPPDHDHNFVDTRRELIQYDPGLAKLCKEVFGRTKLVYTKAPTRLVGHLQGYDPNSAPTFVWPERLNEVKKQIRAEAQNRK